MARVVESVTDENRPKLPGTGRGVQGRSAGGLGRGPNSRYSLGSAPPRSSYPRQIRDLSSVIGRSHSPNSSTLHTHLLQEVQVDSCEVGRLAELEIASGSDGTAPSARNEGRKVFLVVLVTVAETGPIDDHAVVEKRATLRFWDLFHAAEQVGHLLVMPAHNPGVHVVFFFEPTSSS